MVHSTTFNKTQLFHLELYFYLKLNIGIENCARARCPVVSPAVQIQLVVRSSKTVKVGRQEDDRTRARISLSYGRYQFGLIMVILIDDGNIGSLLCTTRRRVDEAISQVRLC